MIIQLTPPKLALTHFCDLHGPKTILCTQVRPVECTLCIPPSPLLREKTSFDSYTTQIQDDQPPRDFRPPRRLRRTDTDFALSPDSPTTSPRKGRHGSVTNIEAHPLFRRSDCSGELGKTPFDKTRDASCASCTFTVPQQIAAKIPRGAPGSLKDGGKTKTGPPILRSRELICLGKGHHKHSQEEPSSSQESQMSSSGSFGSVGSRSDCHDHTLTYLTSKGPDDQPTFAKLGKSVIRALSCEVLPRGMSEGPFCFGDATSGYTIAYVFRLTDPKARGRRRAYAFVALAGKDGHRAFKACPMLWEAFAAMSKIIEQAAQRYQDEQETQQQKARDEEFSRESQGGYTPISSFLTQRPRDPDGQPRRAGQTQPRSLAEIIGDESIFAILHGYFVHLLRCLGDRFGGMPLASEDNQMGYKSMVDDEDAGSPEGRIPARVSTDIIASLSLEDDNETASPKKSKPSSNTKKVGTSTASSTPSKNVSTTIPAVANTSTVNDRPSSKHSNTGSTRTLKRNSQCADSIAVDVARPRQVAV